MGWSGGGQIFGYIWLGQKLQKLENVGNNQNDIGALFYIQNIYIFLNSLILSQL